MDKVKINGILVKKIPVSKRTDKNDYEVYISVSNPDKSRYKVIAKIANRVMGEVPSNSPIKVDFIYNEAFANDMSDKTIVALRIIVQIYDVETDQVVLSKRQDYYMEEKNKEFIPHYEQPGSAVDNSILGYWHKSKLVGLVEGPFADPECKTIVTEVKIGTRYYFKATPKQTLHEPELLAIKWSYRYDDGEITRFNFASEKVVGNTNVMSCIFHKEPKEIKVYAFFKQPNEKVAAIMTVFGAVPDQQEDAPATENHTDGGCFCNRDITETEFVDILHKLRDSEPQVKKDHGYTLFSKANCKLSDKSQKNFIAQMNQTFTKYGINTCIRKLHFLAQAYLETDRFRTTLEYKSDKEYKPYYGRGFMQLTWKSNYEIYGSYVKKDLVTNYDQVAENLFLCADSAGWYWQQGKVLSVGKRWKGPAKRPSFLKNVAIDYPKKTISWKKDNETKKYGAVNLNLIADDDKVDLISFMVNGGSNGLEERRKYVKTLKGIFKYPEQCQSKGNAGAQNPSETAKPETTSNGTSVLEEMKGIVDKHIVYSQSGERAAVTAKGLANLDCSETVAIYLYKLGVMSKPVSIYTGAMTTQSDFRKAIGTDNIDFVAGSASLDFKPKKGDIFVWRRSDGVGHTGIVYKYDETNDLVTILEAIGEVGSADETTNTKNGGYTGTGCSRTAVYKRSGKALAAHAGWKGYFRPKNFTNSL